MGNSQIKVGSFVKSTDTGVPVDQAITGIGFTPKALILFSTLLSADDTLAVHLSFSLGFSDGTDSRCVWTGCQDALSTSDNNRFGDDSKIINLRSVTSGGSALGEADLKSFDIDGFTLAWTVNTANSYIIKYIAIGGDDITADVFEFTQKTSTGSQSVTTALNTADFVLIAHPALTGMNVATVHGFMGIGMATGPSNEGAMCLFSFDNVGTSNNSRFQRADRCLVIATGDSPQTIIVDAEFTNFTATGFDLNYLNADASARVCFGLTIKGGTWEVGNDVTKASTGLQAYTTTVKPAGMIQFGVANIATNLVAAESDLDFGASSGPSQCAGGFGIDEDNLSTTNSGRIQSDLNVMNIFDGAGTFMDKARVDSFNALDFTLDFSVADATQRQFIWAVLEQVDDADTGVRNRNRTGSMRPCRSRC